MLKIQTIVITRNWNFISQLLVLYYLRLLTADSPKNLIGIFAIYDFSGPPNPKSIRSSEGSTVRDNKIPSTLARTIKKGGKNIPNAIEMWVIFFWNRFCTDEKLIQVNEFYICLFKLNHLIFAVIIHHFNWRFICTLTLSKYQKRRKSNYSETEEMHHVCFLKEVSCNEKYNISVRSYFNYFEITFSSQYGSDNIEIQSKF